MPLLLALLVVALLVILHRGGLVGSLNASGQALLAVGLVAGALALCLQRLLRPFQSWHSADRIHSTDS